MKYQAETDAVYDALINIKELVRDNDHRLNSNQHNDINYRIEHINYLIKRKLPLKAKREIKLLDNYIDDCLYVDESGLDWSFNVLDFQ